MSLAALQCELRALFLNRPANRALVEVLHRIGRHLGAHYAVVHARAGVHVLSEEWMRDEDEISSETREQVNTILWETMSSEAGRSTDLNDGSVVVTAVMYDEDVEPSGGAALVLRKCDPALVQQALLNLEGILGYLALLLGGVGNERAVAERRDIKPTETANHPLRLAFSVVAEIENRYGFDVTAMGFVEGNDVEVVAISGVDEVRASNPGVAVIRGAMLECLDRREAVVYAPGRSAEEQVEDDCRLHAQWSGSLENSPVASFPLVVGDEVVAIVAVSQGAGTPVTRDQVLIVAEEVSGYAALVPLSRAATRGLGRHALDNMRDAARRLGECSKRKASVLAATIILVVGWLAFGQMSYTFTVPCTVKAANLRTVSCPRSGVLAELFVRPGDHVREGQLLAALDASDDYLLRAEVRAEIDSLEALVDQALADRETGQLRIHEARKRSLLAQLAIIEASIEQTQVRAPQEGLILNGDLRERLGGRLTLGEQMFELARYDQAAVVVRIPENQVLAAMDWRTAHFAPAASPDQSYELQALKVAPASTVVDERNVFLGEAIVPVPLEQVAPGMEGVVYIDAGPRRVSWVLTHRLTDWLRLNFWI